MPAKRRAWRATIYAVIQTMTAPLLQGELTIARMCALAGVSRAGFYRSMTAREPVEEEKPIGIPLSDLSFDQFMDIEDSEDRIDKKRRV